MIAEALSYAGSNLSEVWARVFLDVLRSPNGIRHPSMVSIQCEDELPLERPDIRKRLDEELARCGLKSCETVSGTIFPRSMWNPYAVDDAALLFRRYGKAWPGIKKCPANRLGVYFRRLTAYGGQFNQLEHIIQTYSRGNHRKSALQAAIMDPHLDHTNNRVKGFPCMQQVAFTPLGENSLSVTGFYATQYQFDKAYGNYLGLYWLGRFMAKQLGLELKNVTCISTPLSLGSKTKQSLASFKSDLESILGGT